MHFHERKQEPSGFSSWLDFLRELVISKLVAGEQAARESFQNLGAHLVEYAVTPLKVRGQRNVRPRRVGCVALRLASIERQKYFVGVSGSRPKGAVFPRGTAVHDGLIDGEKTVPTNLGVEEKEKMNSARSVVDVGLETGKHGVYFLSERDAVVVRAAVPLIDDLPDRAGFRTASGPRTMRRQAGDLHAIGNQALEKQPRIARKDFGVRRITRNDVRKSGSSTCMIINGMDMEIRLEPAGARHRSLPLVRRLSIEAHRPSPAAGNPTARSKVLV